MPSSTVDEYFYKTFLVVFLIFILVESGETKVRHRVTCKILKIHNKVNVQTDPRLEQPYCFCFWLSDVEVILRIAGCDLAQYSRFFSSKWRLWLIFGKHPNYSSTKSAQILVFRPDFFLVFQIRHQLWVDKMLMWKDDTFLRFVDNIFAKMSSKSFQNEELIFLFDNTVFPDVQTRPLTKLAGIFLCVMILIASVSTDVTTFLSFHPNLFTKCKSNSHAIFRFFRKVFSKW